MKATDKKKMESVKVGESELLSLVADKLKDRVLFPRQIEEAKKHLKNLKVANAW